MNQVGLLNQNVTQVMEKYNITNIPIVKINNQAVFTLNMLYDFWLIYVYKNDLIRDQYIYPDVVVHNLLYDLFKSYGASEVGFLLSTFLRMLGTQISFRENINLDISQQANKLRMLRMGYHI